MIKLYLYEKSSSIFFREDVGFSQYVISDMPDYLDFTLTPPPDYFKPWYWYDNKWQSEPKPTP